MVHGCARASGGYRRGAGGAGAGAQVDHPALRRRDLAGLGLAPESRSGLHDDRVAGAGVAVVDGGDAVGRLPDDHGVVVRVVLEPHVLGHHRHEHDAVVARERA